MGRSGGGGGGHSGGSHGGSHHSSSHHSSVGRSSSSSHSYSRPSSSRPGGYRPSGGYGYSSGYNSGYRRGYRRGYGSGYGYNTRPGYNAAPRPAGGSPAGCLSFIVIMFIVMIFMIGAAAFGGGTMTDNNLAEYTQDQYKEIFGAREDCMLMVLVDDDEGSGQITYGNKANGIMDRYVDVLWDNYDANWDNDLGIQIKGMFYDTIADMRKAGNVKKISSEKSFTSSCYKDNLNWVDTKANLVDGVEAFYNETGIQAYILFVKPKTVAKATNKSTGVLKVLIIAVAVIIVISILFTWWKKRVAQKNKEQEDLEHILNTPLETFGTTEMQDLEAKYENAPGYTPPANNTPSQPSTPQAPAQPEAPANNSADSGSYWQNEGGSQNTYGGQDASFWANAANTDDPNNNQ